MKNRIQSCFTELQNRGQCALVTYVMAGDPDAEVTLNVMRSLVNAGADIIELGVPFSDPMADGPVIQRAAERALKNGMSLRGVLDIVTEFRREYSDTPIVLMGYLNPIEAMGYTRFSDKAAAAGVDGVLVVDVPPEEANAINGSFTKRGLDQIFLIAPNSSDARIDNVCDIARGFVYYVGVKGVTGSKAIDSAAVGSRIEQFRHKLSLPIGIGFGIKSADSAAAVALVGDAVIVGSAIIEIVEQHAADPDTMVGELGIFVTQLRDALNRVRAA